MPVKKLNIFISWSGERSRVVAQALREWLPEVLQLVEPFLSTEDIEKGAKWAQVLSGKLERATFSIICLTPENLASPWLLFEAGAVAKQADSRVYTYLLGLNYTDVRDPLSQFQHTRADKNDTQKLLAAINHNLGEASLEKTRLDRAFEKWWPDLERRLAGVPAEVVTPKAPKDPIATILAMTTELLERVREQTRAPTVSSDFENEEERVEFSSLVVEMLSEHLKREHIPFRGIGRRTDGNYFIWQENKSWLIGRLIAEDCAIGRMSVSELLSKSSQAKNLDELDKLPPLG